MLEITVPENEFYHSGQKRFIDIPSCVLSLEHSLISIAKWESKWHIPYLSAAVKKTAAQELDYIRCMVVGVVKNEYVFSALTPDNMEQIRNYIDDPMTATTFSKTQQSRNRQIVTAELLYAKMFANNIPMECQKWHLNRLLTLIRVCDSMSNPPTKMSKKQAAARYAEQNALRRAQFGTKG